MVDLKDFDPTDSAKLKESIKYLGREEHGLLACKIIEADRKLKDTELFYLSLLHIGVFGFQSMAGTLASPLGIVSSFALACTIVYLFKQSFVKFWVEVSYSFSILIYFFSFMRIVFNLFT